MNKILYFVLLFTQITLSDKIVFKDEVSSTATILDTSGCTVIIEKNGNIINIDKNKISYIIINKDSVFFNAFVCAEEINKLTPTHDKIYYMKLNDSIVATQKEKSQYSLTQSQVLQPSDLVCQQLKLKWKRHKKITHKLIWYGAISGTLGAISGADLLFLELSVNRRMEKDLLAHKPDAEQLTKSEKLNLYIGAGIFITNAILSYPLIGYCIYHGVQGHKLKTKLQACDNSISLITDF
jgi:hypothetical protein